MDIKLNFNLSFYASIMLDAFKDLLCSKLCWHNRPGPSASRPSGFGSTLCTFSSLDDSVCLKYFSSAIL